MCHSERRRVAAAPRRGRRHCNDDDSGPVLRVWCPRDQKRAMAAIFGAVTSLLFVVSMALGTAGIAIAQAPQDATAGSPPGQTKGHATLIGCLSGPDKDGKYTLRSMSQRTGVEVFGPGDLKSASGSKVKLTGLWTPGDQPVKEGSAKKAGKFQATELEVMAATCEAPIEKTPISKEKEQRQQQQKIEHQIEEQQHQQQQQKQDSGANPPPSGDASSPK
jgi:hypothetical protein